MSNNKLLASAILAAAACMTLHITPARADALPSLNLDYHNGSVVASTYDGINALAVPGDY